MVKFASFSGLLLSLNTLRQLIKICTLRMYFITHSGHCVEQTKCAIVRYGGYTCEIHISS